MLAALHHCLILGLTCSQPAILPQQPMPSECLRSTVQIDGADFPYLLLPPANVEEGKSYPLVLFLHGAGERGSDNKAHWRHFPERMASAEYREKYPCFVLAPQCPEEQTWVDVNWSDPQSTPISATPTAPMRAAIAALEKVVQSQPVDRDRILLTGLSMGGYGTWDLAMRHADWFAGAVAVCGGGDENSVPLLAGLPMQAWHGASDGVVRPVRSRVMIEAAKKWQMPIEYFELKGIGHDSWVDAYGEKGCLDWLFRQKRDPQKRQKAVAGLLATAIAQSGDGKGTPASERIAFLGDSITQSGNNKGGYVDQIRTVLKKHAPSATVIPAGISGHKVPDLLRRVQRDVIDQKATLVLIYIGINDVWHSLSGNGTSPKDYEAGLHKLIHQLQESGADVVLATPSLIGEKPHGENELDTLLADFVAISKRVAEKENLVLCDLQQAFRDHLDVFRAATKNGKANPAAAGVLTTDGVHLNAAGNTLVATEAAAALLQAVRNRD